MYHKITHYNLSVRHLQLKLKTNRWNLYWQCLNRNQNLPAEDPERKIFAGYGFFNVDRLNF
jgi:hypothetical protein